jgi:hypothetical protein
MWFPLYDILFKENVLKKGLKSNFWKAKHGYLRIQYPLWSFFNLH